jgi:predicted transcriptional regulator
MRAAREPLQALRAAARSAALKELMGGTPRANDPVMLRVRDIMTRRVVSLGSDRPLEAATWLFATEHVSGAPVRDPDGRVVGILSKTDLVDPMRRGHRAQTVGEAMTPAVWAVRPGDAVVEAARVMLAREVHRVVVLDEDGELAGILTAMDVLRAVVEGFAFHDDAAAGEGHKG